MIASFDDLEVLGIKRRSIPIKRYFDEMALTSDQKNERTALADKYYETMLTFMELVSVGLAEDSINWEYIEIWLTLEIQTVVSSSYAEGDEQFAGVYPAQAAAEIVDATRRAIALDTPDTVYTPADNIPYPTSANDVIGPVNKEAVYMLSTDRATYVAENEANSIYNRAEYIDAKAAGMQYKTWVSQRDANVRPTHQEVDYDTIPIDAFFSVGDAIMLYPKDVINAADNPEEIVNCRCTISYS